MWVRETRVVRVNPTSRAPPISARSASRRVAIGSKRTPATSTPSGVANGKYFESEKHRHLFNQNTATSSHQDARCCAASAHWRAQGPRGHGDRTAAHLSARSRPCPRFGATETGAMDTDVSRSPQIKVVRPPKARHPPLRGTSCPPGGKRTRRARWRASYSICSHRRGGSCCFPTARLPAIFDCSVRNSTAPCWSW